MDLLPLSTCRFQRMAGLGIASKTHRGFAGVLDVLVVATQAFFIFNLTWGDDPIWRTYFSDGLVQPPTIVDVLVNIDTSFGWFFFDVWMVCWGYEIQKLASVIPFVFLNSMHLVAIHTWAGLVSFLLMVQKSGVHQLRLLVYPCLSMFIPVFSRFDTSKRWFSRAGFLNHQQYQVPFLPLKHTKMLPMQTCKPLWRLVEAGHFVEFPTKKLHREIFHRGTSRFFCETSRGAQTHSEKNHRNPGLFGATWGESSCKSLWCSTKATARGG